MFLGKSPHTAVFPASGLGVRPEAGALCGGAPRPRFGGGPCLHGGGLGGQLLCFTGPPKNFRRNSRFSEKRKQGGWLRLVQFLKGGQLGFSYFRIGVGNFKIW